MNLGSLASPTFPALKNSSSIGLEFPCIAVMIPDFHAGDKSIQMFYLV
jgi:hypothetical protein